MLNVLRNRLYPQYVKSAGSTEGGFWISFCVFFLFVNVQFMLQLLSVALQDGHISTAPKKGSKKMSSSVQGRGKEGPE